ncbi:MAG: sodium:proton antiporter [Deltaproteobacteria bacterium]|jgi:CPA1 family monovalent cation:H+ antiporter
MDILTIISVLISLSAVFSFINYRYFRLPRTIGLMLFALVLSIVLIVIGRTGWDLRAQAAVLIQRIDFNRFLLQGVLGFLLFAGALHVEANELMQHKWIIFSLATAGTIFSTILVGVFAWLLLRLMDPAVPLIYCLLFGALISPTDPVAVLGILKELKVPKSIETQMAGEALFNDGVGVVLFIVLMRIATGGPDTSIGQSALLFAEEAFGGILIGLAIGWIAYQMLKRVDNYQVEVLITLGLVMGGYDLAHRLHTSGPLAIVAAGLLIGNHGRAFAMSETTRKNLDTFWELIDEILNAILFILIGIEVLVLEINFQYFLAGLMIIPLVLLVRLVSVGVPFGLIRQRMPFRKNAVKTLTWGGLRGGIAVALALSIPPGPQRGIIVFITYMVVVFSIVVQGLTIKKLLKKWGV